MIARTIAVDVVIPNRRDDMMFTSRSLSSAGTLQVDRDHQRQVNDIGRRRLRPLGSLSSSRCLRQRNISVTTRVAAAITVIAAAIHFASAASKTENRIDYTCTNEDDYYFALPGSRCTSYYKCNRDRSRTTHDCQLGSTFDFYKQTCTRNTGICYEPVCTGRINGIYPDTTHACRRSFMCRHGQLRSFDNCPRLQLHNGRKCSVQDDVTCELPQTTAIAYPYSGDRRCTGLPDGNHAAENTECHRYLTCRLGEVDDDIECADGYLFDDRTRQCLPRHLVSACVSAESRMCQKLKNGYNADPTSVDCRAYIKCSMDRFVSREYCSEQAVFNGHQCVPKPLYDCPSGDGVHFPKKDICKHKANGLWSDARTGCHTYIRCENGISVEQRSCSRDHYFDPETRRCVYNNRKCKMTQASSECLQLEMGFYQDKSSASSCRNYFHCYNGNRTDFQCSIGRVYDGENCVPAESYVCPNKNPDSCHSKADGYYKDVHASCRSYYLCSQGRKYRYFCKDNERFNGTDCVQRKSGEYCPNMGACSGKPDGYYYDTESLCRNYYFCLNQEVVTTLTCRGSKVYNGHECVVADNFQCPIDGLEAESQQINCIPRPRCQQSGCSGSGFFADIDSGCVYYHFCIGNTKSDVQECNEGFVFNGEVCVRREHYACPRYCDGGGFGGNGQQEC